MSNDIQLNIIAVDAASNIIKNIGGQFGWLGEVGVSALTAVGGAMDYLIKAGSEEEDTLARFNSLVSTSALSGYKDQMLQMAQTLSTTTRFQKDNIIAAEGQLSIYSNIGQDIFPQVLKASLNLATFMKGDATQGAQTLGRAFEDIAGGSLTYLYRQKLITKAQEDEAKAMAQNGGAVGASKYAYDQLAGYQVKTYDYLMKTTGATAAYNYALKNLSASQMANYQTMLSQNGAQQAQTYILDILNNKIGNLSTDMAQDFPGKMEIFNNAWKDFGEGEGKKALDALEPLMQDLLNLENYVLPQIGMIFENNVLPAFSDFTDTIQMLLSGNMNVSDLIEKMFLGGDVLSGKLKDWAAGFDWKGFSDSVASAIMGLDWSAYGAEFGTTAKNIGSALVSAFKGIDWMALGVGLASSFDNFVIGGLHAAFGIGDVSNLSGLHSEYAAIGTAYGKTLADGMGPAFWKEFWPELGTYLSGASVSDVFMGSVGLGGFWNGLFGGSHAWTGVDETISLGFETHIAIPLQNFFSTLGPRLWKYLSVDNIFGHAWTGRDEDINLFFETHIANPIINAVDGMVQKFDLGTKLVNKVATDIVNGYLNINKAFNWAIIAAVDDALAAVGIKNAFKLPPKPQFGPGAATGADFIVPPGYPNDSYPLRVQSGEHVIVIPAGQVGSGSGGTGGNSSGKVLTNNGVINIMLSGSSMTVSNFMTQLGAAMGG